MTKKKNKNPWAGPIAQWLREVDPIWLTRGSNPSLSGLKNKLSMCVCISEILTEQRNGEGTMA